MARTKTYDSKQARTGLVSAFLQHGYGAVSLPELEQRSGLNRRQLYNDFGDKQAMFVLALEDFAAVAAQRFLSPLEQREEGIAAIATTLRALVAAAPSAEGRLGCLICNSAREPIAEQADVKQVIDTYFRRIEAGYATALQRAKHLDELADGADTANVASYLLGIHVSLCVLCRAGESPSRLSAIAECAIASLQGSIWGAET